VLRGAFTAQVLLDGPWSVGQSCVSSTLCTGAMLTADGEFPMFIDVDCRAKMSLNLLSKILRDRSSCYLSTWMPC